MFEIAQRDWQAVGQAYAQDNRLRLEQFLTPQSAQRFHASVNQLPAFHQACFLGGAPTMLSQQQFAAMTAVERKDVWDQVAQQAARGGAIGMAVINRNLPATPTRQ